MKTALTALFCLSLAFTATACNFASLNDAPKMSRAELKARGHGRINEGAFRPISSAPGYRHGG